MPKVVIFYYTQTGQILNIAQSVCKPLLQLGFEVVYKEIIPVEKFPYPWSGKEFFQAFPESREAIPCEIEKIDFDDINDVNLIIVAFQVWFLSPSIPIHSFFQDKDVQNYLKGKNIVTIDGCRNMWVMAHKKVKEYISNSGGKLGGNIVLQDRHPNLISVLTIVRWLLRGKKQGEGLLPTAGVSDNDIKNASVFGEILSDAIKNNTFDNLQDKLMLRGAIKYKPSIVFIEKNGHRIFGIWSKFILKKGGHNSPNRNFRLKLFEYYLYTVLYLVSPIGLLFFYLTYPFRYKKIQKDKKCQCFGICS